LHTAFLINQLAPYRARLLQALDRRLEGGVGVIALSAVEPNRSWEGWGEVSFPVRVLGGRTIVLGTERFLHLTTGCGRMLREWRPRVLVVGGWDSPAYWAGLWHARRLAIPLAVWTGSHDGTATARQPQRLLRRVFLRRADLALAYGQRAAAFALAQGVASERVVTVGNPVAVEDVAGHARAFRSSAAGVALSATLSRPCFLYAGQLIERKRLLDALEAVAEVSPTSSFLIAGDGPLEHELRRRLEAHPTLDARLLGALSPERVWELLGVVDALVLPSSNEVWGLVVNEALAAGVLPIVSIAAGAAELVREGALGELAGDGPGELEQALGRAVKRLPLPDDERDRLFLAARAYDVDVTAERIATALEALAGREPGSGSTRGD
jgi:glycosyltransferase involved in cell wall biosynthesis